MPLSFIKFCNCQQANHILLCFVFWAIISFDLKAQSNIIELWVGESWEMQSPSNNYYAIWNVNWETDLPNYINLNWENEQSCIITPTKYFSGTAHVTITYNYKLTQYGSTRFHSLTRNIVCIDNPITISPTSKTLLIGETFQLVYSHHNNDYTSVANVTFTSSSDVVSVSSSGKVTSLRAGTAKVFVHSNLANDENAPYCTVTVNEPAQAPVIELPKTMLLNIGQSMKITPLKSPGVSYTITWKSNKTTVATVNSLGVVTAKNVGTARITATINETSQSDYCDVTVKDILLGDVNDDGTVNIADVTALIDLLLNGTSYYNAAADMNQDGSVNIADVTALIDYLLNGGGKKGDVNNDGQVNIADVTALIDFLLNGIASINRQNADVNSDGHINIADVTALIDYLLNGNISNNKLSVEKDDSIRQVAINNSITQFISKTMLI